MNWSHIAQAVDDLLSVVALIRIVSLRLHNVYRLFCAFVFVQLLGSLIAFVENLNRGHHPDYRLTWIPLQPVLWILSLWIVYALLSGVLQNLPGILKFSRRLLNVTFFVALLVALWSAKAEYGSSNAAGFEGPMARAVGMTLVLNRAVSTAALIALIAILCFVLWFPVQMPRNLALFSFGFAVYFAAKTVSLLTWSLWAGTSYRLIDNLTMFMLSVCYIYWSIFITAEGELVKVRIGHSWHAAEQERLVRHLETLNSNLLRASRR